MNQKEAREQAIREAKRNLILDAARAVFANSGFHETRLEDIAAEAGFSKASLYNYYPDKEAIFLNLARREMVQLLQRLEEAIEEQDSLENNLRRMIHGLLMTFGEHFAFLLTMVHFPVVSLCNRTDSAVNKDGFVNQMQGIVDAFARAIALGRSRGEVHSVLDDMVLARFISGTVRSTFFKWRFAGTMGDAAEEVESIVCFVIGGVQGVQSVT